MAGLINKLFGKVQDESPEEQIADINIEEVRKIAITRTACDTIQGTEGPFGQSPTNPIPVNCVLGEIKYINSLICSCGVSLIGHRLGHFKEKRFFESLDVYETVCAEGVHWEVLYLNMYFPQRSKKTPLGYTFRQFHETFSRTIIGMTTNVYVEPFPEAMINFPKQLGIAEALERAIIKKIGYRISQGLPMVRPENHEIKLHYRLLPLLQQICYN